MTVLIIEDAKQLLKLGSPNAQRLPPEHAPTRMIHFFPGTTELKPESLEALDRHARKLQCDRKLKLSLHAPGTDSEALAKARCQAIRQTLHQRDVSPAQLADTEILRVRNADGWNPPTELVYAMASLVGSTATSTDPLKNDRPLSANRQQPARA